MTAVITTAARKPHFARKKIVLLVALTVVLLIAGGFALFFARTTFPLIEIPAPDNLYSGSHALSRCVPAPEPMVKRYPRFISSNPIFGRITLANSPPGASQGRTFCFALDETKGTGQGWDRLYFDANENLDLTDDAPCGQRTSDAKSTDAVTSCTYFANVSIPWDYGPPVGVRTLPLASRLVWFHRGGVPELSVIPATVRRGFIRIGNHFYRVTLARADEITGRYDGRGTAVSLTRIPSLSFLEFGGQTSGSYRRNPMKFVNGKWYRLRPDPLGNWLSVERYDGDLGLLEPPGSGVLMLGSLAAKDASYDITAPDGHSEDSFEYTGGVSLPVGDYAIGSLRLGTDLSNTSFARNTSSDGVSYDEKNHPPRYFIEIRKDKPFVIQMPSKLDVLFTSPKSSRRFWPGGKVQVSAVLLDPEHDVMVTDITDVPAGPSQPRAVRKQLDAEIKITDLSGKVLSQGNCSIETLRWPRFFWQVPGDFDPKGGEETLTVTVTFDAGSRYGKIEASREIIVEARPE